MKKTIRFIPILLIIVLLIVAFKCNVSSYLNFKTLKVHHLELINYVNEHFITAMLVFSSAYIILVVTSFPGATFFSLLSGFLFGSTLGTVLVVIAATIGATLLFLAVRLALGDIIRNRFGYRVQFMEKNLEQNAFFYLLSLRLMPIMPFWLINLVAGIFNIKFRDFIITTFLGIIPGAFVYVNIGSSLTTIFGMNDDFKVSSLVNPNILIALMLLALLSIIPAIIKSKKKVDN